MAHPQQQPVSPDQPARQPDAAVGRTLDILAAVFGPARERPFDIHLWDGTVQMGTGAKRADYALHLRKRGALRRMLIRPSELSIVEAFISGDIDVEGNLESVMSIGDAIGSRLQSLTSLAALMPKVLLLPKDDDPELDDSRYSKPLELHKPAARKSTASEIEFHYGVGNEFYALWLDPRMQYTCAYYRTPTTDLATAQTDKLDHICRKLRLKPGERLLDIGCGWGGLVQYAVEHYGVTALGVTLSDAQAEWAQRSIAAKGLSDRCTVMAKDFRDLPPEQQFDKISSVGVTEHVPEDAQPEWFARIYAALKPGGLLMNHCEVSLNRARSRNTKREKLENWFWKRDQFIDKYVFPDARLVAFGHIVQSAELAGFETRDVESLREHYTMTLRAWLEGLLAHREDATRMVGERTFRIWHLYMTAAAYGFNSGSIGLVQALFSKPMPNGISNVPLTREDMYAGRA